MTIPMIHMYPVPPVALGDEADGEKMLMPALGVSPARWCRSGGEAPADLPTEVAKKHEERIMTAFLLHYGVAPSPLKTDRGEAPPKRRGGFGGFRRDDLGGFGRKIRVVLRLAVEPARSVDRLAVEPACQLHPGLACPGQLRNGLSSAIASDSSEGRTLRHKLPSKSTQVWRSLPRQDSKQDSKKISNR